MVYYRKYRPQTIAELDLPDVREKLASLLSSKSIPHAFLFTGSKGLGKTSSARILAKAINCEMSLPRTSGGGNEPCNECQACVSITNGSNIDVLEIDAASNGGVEEIRTLRERVKFASSTLKKKVYIIDEVHMLSSGAFNALLKTLEEPPSHVVFILATTELHRLPATIVSRTFQIQFEVPTILQIAESLKRIVKGEKLDIEDGVLEKIAQISDGAFRDGAKNLEELVLSSKNKKITNALFDNTFKTSGLNSGVQDLLEAYSKKDAKKGLQEINKFAENGIDFKVVIERMVDHLRGLLMLRNGIESHETDIKGLTLENIQNLLELANEAFGELKISVIPQLPLELMTVKYCILDNEENIHRSVDNVQPTFINPVSVVKSIKNIEKSEDKIKVIEKAKSTNSNLLHQIIAEMNLVNKPGAALLRSAKNAESSEGILTIFTPFPVHVKMLLSEKVLPDLQKVADNISGRKVELKISAF